MKHGQIIYISKVTCGERLLLNEHLGGSIFHSNIDPPKSESNPALPSYYIFMHPPLTVLLLSSPRASVSSVGAQVSEKPVVDL